MPTSVIPDVVGMGVFDMLVKTGLLPSKWGGKASCSTKRSFNQ